MKLEKRSVFGWGSTAAGYAPCKNGLVVHYDGSNQGLAGKPHSSCRAYWRATRKFHMGPARGWLDIGYSFGVCPHGIVMEGRGWQRQQAAQPGGNTTWTSCTFMSGDDERPTAAQVAAFKELRAWLRGKGLGSAIKGHRDFVSTSCPGSTLYSMVKSGTLTGAPKKDAAPAPAKDDQQEEDDMPRYYGQLATGKGAITPIAVHPGDVTAIGFICDNGLGDLPPAKIRVAVHDKAKGWTPIKTITVDSTKAKVWFAVPKTTDGLSVRREDDGAVPVAWDAS